MDTVIAIVFLIIGLFCGVWILYSEANIGIEANALIAECELNLSRNEHCIIIAIAKEKDKVYCK